MTVLVQHAHAVVIELWRHAAYLWGGGEGPLVEGGLDCCAGVFHRALPG
jgi:cell wall-associated NlpC family hydrolase